MDITRDLFFRADADLRQEGRVESKPFRQPVRSKTTGIGREDDVEAHRTGGHDLFPLGDLEMRFCGADNRDDDGRAGKARALRLLLLQIEIGIFFERDSERRLAETHPLLTAIDDETPGGELAMIRHAHGKAQDFLDFTFRRSGFAELQGRYGAANLEIIEELDIAGHDQKSSILLSSRN